MLRFHDGVVTDANLYPCEEIILQQKAERFFLAKKSEQMWMRESL